MKKVWLLGEDILVLNDVIEREGWTQVNTSNVAVAAVDRDGIAGFHILRTMPHPEPLWIRPDKRNTGLAEELANDMYNFLKDTNTPSYMVVADTPEAVKLCEHFGMKRIESPVYLKV